MLNWGYLRVVIHISKDIIVTIYTNHLWNPWLKENDKKGRKYTGIRKRMRYDRIVLHSHKSNPPTHVLWVDK